MTLPSSGPARVSSGTLCRLGMAMVVCGGMWAAGSKGNVHAAQQEEGEVFGKVYRCSSGPWGALEYYPIHIEMPDYLVKRFPRPEPTPRWRFRGSTLEEVQALFDRAGLTKELRETLLDESHATLRDGVLTVTPPVADLIAMTPAQRQVIYGELSKSELNPYHAGPICIANGDPDSWYARPGMRQELCDLIKKMSYTRGEVLCFSDVAVLFSKAKSDDEGWALFKALSRTRTLVLRLNMRSSPDPKSVLAYWSAGQRNREIEPILQSAAETEGAGRLDCVHVLPPLARRYLYCYPSEDFPVYATLPDCHWTSLNFFNSTPINYQFDPKMFLQYLAQSYDPVQPPYQFGDVLVLTAPDGTAVHSCTYIADDIVYTKNGETLAAPWLLMKIADVRRFYSFDQRVSLGGYRLK